MCRIVSAAPGEQDRPTGISMETKKVPFSLQSLLMCATGIASELGKERQIVFCVSTSLFSLKLSSKLPSVALAYKGFANADSLLLGKLPKLQ